MATLFEPMTRATSEANAARSIGLGLFIVKEITIAHGGVISIESTADLGTTLSVKLPRS